MVGEFLSDFLGRMLEIGAFSGVMFWAIERFYSPLFYSVMA